MTTVDTYAEKQLLGRIAASDESAFAELLNTYHRAVYRDALKVLRDESLAEDIVQEVFLRIWLRRTTLPEIDNFGAWLNTVTSNKLYDFIRQRKMHQGHVDQWARELNLREPEPTKEETHYETLINEAVQQLSPRQQQAFELMKKQGYSRQEAAALLNVSPETVKTHIESAMRSIRAYCIGKLDNASVIVIFSLILKKYF